MSRPTAGKSVSGQVGDTNDIGILSTEYQGKPPVPLRKLRDTEELRMRQALQAIQRYSNSLLVLP